MSLGGSNWENVGYNNNNDYKKNSLNEYDDKWKHHFFKMKGDLGMA